MFQSDDEITLDDDFLSDAFDLASTTSSVDCPKRHPEQSEGQPLKKICVNPSQNKDTLNILSILNSQPKETEKSRQKSPDDRFIRPVLPSKQRRVVVRKFPGPAGILPAQEKLDVDLKRLENFDNTLKDKTVDSDELVCSQHSEDVFTRPAWRRMVADLTAGPAGAPGVVLPERYTIAWTKACATNRQLLNGKIPFLAALVHQVDRSTRDPMLVLKDRTDKFSGEIQATLIHEVWEQYGEHIHAGVVIVLRYIGVLSTAKRHYLAITLNNLVTIYADQDETSGKLSVTSQNDAVVTKVNHMTSSDFIKTITDVKPCEMPKNNPTRTDTHSRPINAFAAEQTSNQPNHLVFKPNFTTDACDKTVARDTATFLRSDFDKTTEQSSKLSAESEILSQVLDGLDADLIFDEF